MKKIIIVLSVILALTAVADFKAGYIDSDRLRQEYGPLKDAEAQLGKEVAEWEAEAAEKEQEIIDMRTELEQQSLLLSEDKKQERMRLIEQKQMEYQQYLSSILGAGGKADQRNAALTAPILEDINEALLELADREGYDLILDVAGGNVAYIDENLDLTDLLIEELQSQISE